MGHPGSGAGEGRCAAEFRSAGQPRAAVPTWFVVWSHPTGHCPEGQGISQVTTPPRSPGEMNSCNYRVSYFDNSMVICG
ncbi:hypothetical protein SBA1_740030 [Candidatus Sulfotelmatobacter kueseliae]|uniref:Uncharacterized protein n=1 Tax=Candidatus Sulfotelmatobacter kueseliae TaxID=2042962 RepID=A0A2U3L692_9BACT|nr:hypothetical protein SBA1_740030 [Candidatus Sulfotelmatobacter kueseliae]